MIELDLTALFKTLDCADCHTDPAGKLLPGDILRQAQRLGTLCSPLYHIRRCNQADISHYNILYPLFTVYNIQ